MNIKVMTFNIRIDSPEGYSKRLELFADKIISYSPDVICFQEMSHEMLLLTINALSDYFIAGGGRNSNRLGESTVIAYKKNRFVLGNCRTKWLSPTPDIPGSRFPEDQSGCPRVYTMLTLTDIETGTSFRVYNTHLDHIGSIAKINGAEQIMRDMKEDTEIFPTEVILTGDMNSPPTSKPIEIFTQNGCLRDITDKYTQTFNNYGKPLREWDDYKIDFIFVSGGFKCITTHLWDEMPDGKYMSDHYAVCAELEI